MLVRITNRCRMGCSHCFIEDSSPTGVHMRSQVFYDVLRFQHRIDDPVVMLSGGEPFEHPSVFKFAERAKMEGFKVVALSNGMFTLDSKLLARVVESELSIQVTHDSRYYPTKIDEDALLDLSQVTLEHCVRSVFPCSRAIKNGLVGTRLVVPCFNLRSAVLRLKGLKLAKTFLMTKGYFCTPSVNVDGSIRMGEHDRCYRVGTVEDSPNKVLCGILNAKCNRCGLEVTLSESQQDAIRG